MANENGQYRKIICIDFDGVIHAYDSPWAGADVVSDGPVPGAIEFLMAVASSDDLKAVIYSSRSSQEGGLHAMSRWLYDHWPVPERDLYERVEFAHEKPAAFMTIDDRAFCFEGVFPYLDWLREFKPWNKRPQNFAENKLNQLLMEVIRTYPGESHFETARRIIRENQRSSDNSAQKQG